MSTFPTIRRGAERGGGGLSKRGHETVTWLGNRSARRWNHYPQPTWLHINSPCPIQSSPATVRIGRQGTGLLDECAQHIDRPDDTCHCKARPDEKCPGARHLDAAQVLQTQSVKANVYQTQQVKANVYQTQ